MPHPPTLLRNARLQSEYLAAGALEPMPGAPRRHPKSQIRALMKSIKAFGQVLPILVDEQFRIISGHAQLEAATRLGLTEVLVIRIEYLSEPQTKALMIALNRLADLSTWDDKALGTVLLELSELNLDFDLEATGFSLAEIELKIEGLDAAEDKPEPLFMASGPAVTQPGDLWQLGNHRLLCGNALEARSWERLMGDDVAALVVTDPPYNVPIDGHVSGLGKY